MRKKESKSKEYLLDSIIYTLFVLQPLITYLVIYENPFYQYSWYGGDKYSSDLFLNAKGICFLLISIVTVVFAIKLLYKNHRYLYQLRSTELVFLMAYTLLCLLSFIFSRHKAIGLLGSMEQQETILTLLGYGFICFSFSIFAKNHPIFNHLSNAVVVGCLAMVAICVFQFLGHDLLGYSWVQRIVVPASLYTSNNTIELVSMTNDYNRVYGTLYNPNYLGLYGNLMLPILLAALATCSKRATRMIISLVTLFLIFMIFASGSKTFILVGFIQCIIAGIILRQQIMKHWKICSAVVVVIITGFIMYNAVNNNALFKALTRGLTTTSQEYSLESINVNENEVLICYKNVNYHINFQFEDNVLLFQVFDDNGLEYSTYVNDQGLLCFEDTELAGITVSAGRINGIEICILNIDNYPWYFTYYMDSSSYAYITPAGLESKVITADSIGNKYNALFTGRGYIWSRCIPLLKDNVVLGRGPETFMLQFPQNDYVMATNAGHYNELITRPHSVYLQIALQTGVLSMLAYIGIVVTYSAKALRSLHFKKDRSIKDMIWQVSILVSVIGYSFATLVTDSLVVTAPLYWALLGIGIGWNSKKVAS